MSLPMDHLKEPLLANDNGAGDVLQKATFRPNDGSTNSTAIRTRTETCQLLFEECQKNCLSSNDDWIGKMSATFNWWSLGIGAAKSGQSSLDNRVQTRDDVRNVIISLLDSLETSLYNCTRLANAQFPVQHLQTEPKDVDDGVKRQQGSINPDWDEQFYYIKSTLQYLSKISASIRKSGTKFRHQRVDRLLEERAPKLEEFRRYLHWIVLIGPTKSHLLNSLIYRYTSTGEHIWKKSWITLKAYLTDEKRLSAVQKRLIQANLVRRNRFEIYFNMYLRKLEGGQGMMTGEAAKKATVAPKPASTMRPENAPDRPRPNIAPGKKNASSEKAVSVEKTGLSSQPATGIGTFIMPQPPTAQGARSVSTKFSQGALKQDYPKCPITEEGAFWCPYCAQPLDSSYSGRKRDKRWRGHVTEDLSPYVCIYADCDMPDVMYLSSDQWKTHLGDSHSVPRWICDSCWLCSESPENFGFDSRKDWVDHTLSVHDGEFESDDLDDLADSSRRSVIPPVPCPLCYDGTPPLHPETDGHLAEHLHAFALQALPWEATGPDDDTQASVGSGIRNHFHSTSDEHSEGEAGQNTDTSANLAKNMVLVKAQDILKYSQDLLRSKRLDTKLGDWAEPLIADLIYELSTSRFRSYGDDMMHEISVHFDVIQRLLDRLRDGFDFSDFQAIHNIGLDLSEATSSLRAFVTLAEKSLDRPRAEETNSEDEMSDSNVECELTEQGRKEFLLANNRARLLGYSGIPGRPATGDKSNK
ncbi:hypothetical protein PG990_013162 [Apiospora arundinis]